MDPKNPQREDSMVCYCYRLTTSQLRAAYEKCGSLKGVEETTRAGTGCTGCKAILHSLFGEKPSDHYDHQLSPVVGSTCRKPGNRVMKGFIVADGQLESTVCSSNAVAPQLGNCDADTNVEFMLLDHRGIPVVRRSQKLATNETFVFKTADEDFPRPFYGMFLLAFDRSNYGASRFNVYWGNSRGVTSTHENTATGRPRVVVPVEVNKRFLDGPNTIYAGFYNPHDHVAPFFLAVQDLDTREEISWKSELPPYCSMWINANEHLYAPAVAKRPDARFALKLTAMSPDGQSIDMYKALPMYFFIHNRNTDLWSVNHL